MLFFVFLHLKMQNTTTMYTSFEMAQHIAQVFCHLALKVFVRFQVLSSNVNLKKGILYLKKVQFVDPC